MRLSFAVFLWGYLVVYSEAAAPKPSLQWQRRGKWNRRDGNFNSSSSQSLPAQASSDLESSSSSSSISDLPSISSPPPFPNLQSSDTPIPIPLGTGSDAPIPIPLSTGVSVAAEEILSSLSNSSSSSTEQSSSSDIPGPSDLPKINPVISNTSSSSAPDEKPAPSDGGPSNSSFGILFPTAGSTGSSGATNPGIWNGSTTASADNTTITPPPFPRLNSTSSGFNSTGVVKNGSTCGGCIVNAQANVDWWFPANVYLDVASISTITLNGSSSYTAVLLSTFTDINDQLSQETFMFTEYLDPVAGTTVDDYIFTTLPPPIAASTSITTISDISALPTGTFGIDELNALNADPDIPSITVNDAVPTPISATQVDNIAWYTAYEVEFDQLLTDGSGNVVCQKATSTYNLDEPYAYTLDPAITFGDAAVATGPVDENFLNYIPFASCTVGSWTAAPTMIVVVEVTIQRGFNVFLVHHEVSDPGTLDTPTVTDSSAQTTAGSGNVHVEPAVAHIEGSDVTLLVTVTGNPASATVPVGNSVVVASVVGGGSGNTGNNGGGGIASAIISALGGGNTGSGDTGTGNSGSGVGGAIGNVINPAGSGSSGAGSVNDIGFDSSASSPTSGSSGGTGGVPVITVGGETFVGNQATEFSFGTGNTLTPGGVATIGSNTVSLASNAASIVINGQTSQLAVPAVTPAPAIVFQGTTLTADSNGAFTISGQTLTEGGQIVVGSNTISLGGDGSTLVVNGQSITAPPVLATAAPAISIDGTVFSAEAGGESFIIGGSTLTPGGIITVNGNTISLEGGSNPSLAVINGQTVSLAQIFTPVGINVAGTQFSELPGGSFVINGQTLRPGGTIVVAGTTVAFGSDGSYVVINGQTSQLAIGTVPALIIGGTTYAANIGKGGAYVIDGQTLLPGGVITVNGHTISLAANGQTVVIDGSTSFLNTPTTTLPPLLTINGKTYTANAGTTYIIDGLTLTPGGFIVDHGTTISLSPHATALVINGKTTKLFPATNVPNFASAVATSTTKIKTPVGPLSGTATATSKKKGAASSTSTNHGLTIITTLLSFFGALCAWM